MEDNKTIKYSKSKNNHQCLSPCYHVNSYVIHPITLEYHTNKIMPFCAVNSFTILDNNGKEHISNFDNCYNPTDTGVTDKTLELNILIPYINFNSEQFLKIYYKIFSFEDAINWLDTNKFVPFRTQIRIVNSALEAFGDKNDLFDTRIVQFFIEYLKKEKMSYIYSKLSKHIGINKSNNSIQLVKSNDLSDEYQSTERINYIIQKFFDVENVSKFMIKYFKNRNKDWSDIHDHMLTMCDDIINNILNKIIKLFN